MKKARMIVPHFRFTLFNLNFGSEMESRTRGSRLWTQKNLRPRTALPRTDPLEAKDRNAQAKAKAQDQDTGASVLQKKKGSSKNFFRRFPIQKRSSQIYREGFVVFQENFKGLKNSAVLEPKAGQFSRT